MQTFLLSHGHNREIFFSFFHFTLFNFWGQNLTHQEKPGRIIGSPVFTVPVAMRMWTGLEPQTSLLFVVDTY